MAKQKNTVLIVEDEQQWLEYARRNLSPDFDVFTASTVADAAKILESTPRFDAIIVDLMLSESPAEPPQPEAGIRLLEQLKARGDSSPIIIYSAYLADRRFDFGKLGAKFLIKAEVSPHELSD